MIIEIAPELLLTILAPGNEIHAKIEQGIAPNDYRLAGVAMNERGNIALALQHRNDEAPNPAPYSVTVTSLDCQAQLSKLNEVTKERDALQGEIDGQEQYELCDCCGCLSTDTADVDSEGNPLGHVQCSQCDRIAELEWKLERRTAALRKIADGAAPRGPLGGFTSEYCGDVAREALSDE